jgi:hypothetical protein
MFCRTDKQTCRIIGTLVANASEMAPLQGSVRLFAFGFMFTKIKEPTLECICSYDGRDKECIQNFGGEVSEYVHLERREEYGKKIKIYRTKVGRLCRWEVDKTD